MAESNYKTFDAELDARDVSTKWVAFVDRFNDYLITKELEPIVLKEDKSNEEEFKKRDKKIRAHFHVCVGERTYSLYKKEKKENDTYKDVIDKITKILVPMSYYQVCRATFRNIEQLEGEPILSFVSRLREAAKSCEYKDVDEEILSILTANTNDLVLQQHLILNKVKNLSEAIEKGKDLEDLAIQVKKLKAQKAKRANKIESEEINEIKPSINKPNKHNKSQSFKPSSNTSKNTCYKCGLEYPHTKECPAKNKQCHNCGKFNNFAKMCKNTKTSQNDRPKTSTNKNTYKAKNSKTVKKVDHETSDSEEVEYNFEVKSRSKKCKYITCDVKGNDINFLIDTGSTVNIIDEITYSAMKNKPELTRGEPKLLGYNNREIDTIGYFATQVSTSKKSAWVKFVITRGINGNVLGLDCLEELEIVKIVKKIEHQVNYPKLFENRIGKLKDVTIKLHIDENVKPTQQPHRRIPFNVRGQVKDEVEKMLKMDIIEAVEGPTSWISPIVIVPKTNSADKIRICVDMREANTAIKRERIVIPTLEEINAIVNGSKHFSKIDLKAGYHQLELDPSSRYITTFATHIGLYRYKRLNFGITCAAEIFQNTMSQLIADITGAFNYSDDILIHAPTKEQHDIILDKVLKRLEENELTVSSDKCVFDQEEIEFYGMIFSAKGVRLSKSKINAIQNAKPPKNANEVRSFLGLANYVSRFIKDYATTAEPLWKLTKPATKWNWGKEQEEAFEKTKKSLTTVAMAYYNSDWETELITDASPVGLGAILTQYNSKNPDEKTIVAYASRILSDTERRYSHIEKEALASVWGCERFHIYIYGRQFKLITDNKATELIYKNPRSNHQQEFKDGT